MATANYYHILGVPKSASAKEIKQAYRKLARKLHPDVNPGNQDAEAKFKQINEAYEVLSNEESRKRYNLYGKNWKHSNTFEGTGRGRQRNPFSWAWSQAGKTEGASTSFGDIFGSMFSGNAKPRAVRGKNFEHPTEVTLEEAFHGTTRVLQIPLPESKPRQLEVKIPAGVGSGARIRIAGQGGNGQNGGKKGDLYIIVTIRQHSIFTRTGNNLSLDLPVDLTTAVLGGEVEVPTMNGAVLLSIPPETQNGKTFRLQGKGMPKVNGPETGDLRARVKVVLPINLSETERSLFEQLRRNKS